MTLPKAAAEARRPSLHIFQVDVTRGMVHEESEAEITGRKKKVTAFYNKASGSYQFEMSVSRWDIDEFDKLQDAPVQAW